MILLALIASLQPAANAPQIAALIEKHCQFPYLAAAVAFKESSLRSDAINVNESSIDVGLFQINSVHGYSEDYLLDIENNVRIGCEIIESHASSVDPDWIGAFHSKTPSKKKAYADHIRKLLTVKLSQVKVN